MRLTDGGSHRSDERRGAARIRQRVAGRPRQGEPSALYHPLSVLPSAVGRGAGPLAGSAGGFATGGHRPRAAALAPARPPTPNGVSWAGPTQLESSPPSDDAPPTTGFHPRRT